MAANDAFPGRSRLRSQRTRYWACGRARATTGSLVCGWWWSTAGCSSARGGSKRAGWYQAFVNEPIGRIQAAGRELRVRAVTRGDGTDEGGGRRGVRRQVPHARSDQVREGICAVASGGAIRRRSWCRQSNGSWLQQPQDEQDLTGWTARVAVSTTEITESQGAIDDVRRRSRRDSELADRENDAACCELEANRLRSDDLGPSTRRSSLTISPFWHQLTGSYPFTCVLRNLR